MLRVNTRKGDLFMLATVHSKVQLQGVTLAANAVAHGRRNNPSRE